MTSTAGARARLPGGRTRFRITTVATLVAAAILIPLGLIGSAAITQSQQSAVRATALAQAQGMTGLLSAATLPENYQGDLPFQVSTEEGRILATGGDISDFQVQGAIGLDSWDPMYSSGGSFAFRSTVVQLRSGGATANKLDGLAVTTIDTYVRVGALEASARQVPPESTVRVLVFITPSEIDGFPQDTQRLIIIAVPLALVVLAVAVWLSVGSALRPVARLSRQVNTITDSRLASDIPVPPTGDEVQNLAITLNSLLARLNRNETLQRTFLDDAAHELRSPITSLLTTLEVAERYPDAVDWRHTIEAATRQARRLQLLSEDLLLLGGLSAGPMPDAVVIDLSALLARTVEECQTACTIDARVVEGITVGGRERDLERLILNLLDNADRYAATQIRVALTRSVDGLRAIMSVENDGPAIPAGSEELIFERLVRLDLARDSATGGSGLGLAIARQIAQNHGGTLIAVARSGGAEFRLELPIAPEAGHERRPQPPAPA